MAGTLTLSCPNLFLSPENRLPSRPTAASSLKFRPSGRCRASVAEKPRAFAVTEKPRAAGSFYDILRVNHNASQTEIKRAYRTLAKLYHPDASFSAHSISDDGLDFIEIHNAYATLSDPAARAHYDMSLGAHYRRSSSSSFGYYSTRRWETDQCW